MISLLILTAAIMAFIYGFRRRVANREAQAEALRRIDWIAEQAISNKFSAPDASRNSNSVAIGAGCTIATQAEIDAWRVKRRLAKKLAKAERAAKALDKATPMASARSKAVRL